MSNRQDASSSITPAGTPSDELDEIEREKIKERTQRGKYVITASGRLLCAGPVKYGYQYDREARSRVIDPETAPVVRQIFTWAGEDGCSIREIARRLNQRGIEPPFGQKKLRFRDGRVCVWGKTTVRRILCDEAYIGQTFVNCHKAVGKYRNGRQRLASIPREQWREMPRSLTPPIVTPQLFAAVQARLNSPANPADGTRNAKRAYLLRGFIFCAHCGWRMYSEAEKGGLRVYRCSSRNAKGTNDTPWSLIFVAITEP